MGLIKIAFLPHRTCYLGRLERYIRYPNFDTNGGRDMNREVKRVPIMKAALPQLMRVAAYARVSSAKDAMRHSLSA